MIRKKNDYSITVFNKENQYLGFIKYVHNIKYTANWLNNSRRFNQWYYMNIYNRRSRNFIKRVYRNEQIDKFY